MTSSAFRSSHTLVVDTSAVLAIALEEPGYEPFLRKLTAAGAKLSAACLVECRIVLLAKDVAGSDSEAYLERLLVRFRIEVVAVDEAQAWLAASAYRRFGKGRHPARLNFGDCFSYALAKQLGEPLLFKGDDFSQTDITPALQPDTL